MGVIDLEALSVDVIDVTTEELLASLDNATREVLGLSSGDFLALVRAGEVPDTPEAIGLEVLARALIERG